MCLHNVIIIVRPVFPNVEYTSPVIRGLHESLQGAVRTHYLMNDVWIHLVFCLHLFYYRSRIIRDHSTPRGFTAPFKYSAKTGRIASG